MAVCLLAISIVGAIAAKNAAARGTSAAAMQHDNHQRSIEDEVRSSLSEYDRMSITVCCVFVAGSLTWCCLLYRREWGRQSIPLVLLVSAILLQLLQV